MNRLSSEQEQKLLKECIGNNRKDLFIQEYKILIDKTIIKTLEKFPILKDKYLNEKEINMLSNHVLLNFFKNDYYKLKEYDKDRMRLSTWVKMLTSRMVIDFARMETKRLFVPLDGDCPESFFIDNLASPSLIYLKISISQSLEKFSKRDAEVFKLFLMGFTAKETSETMSLTEDNVYQIISRIRKKLKNLIFNER